MFYLECSADRERVLRDERKAHAHLVWRPFDPGTDEGYGSYAPNEVSITTSPTGRMLL